MQKENIQLLKNEKYQLSRREFECIEHLLEGHTFKKIAQILNLSPRTVEAYVKNIRMKMGVRSKKALIEKVKQINEQHQLMEETE